MRWTRWLRRRSDDDFADEIESHLAMEEERLRRSGLSADEARFAARRAFGNTTARREEFHDSRPGHRIESLAQDVRYGLRSMRHTPAFTAIAVASFAIGIGANTTMFGAVDALLVRTPDHVRDADRIYRVYFQTPGRDGQPAPAWPYQGYKTYLALRDSVTGFESVVKGAEEASPEFRARGFFKAIWMAIAVGILFYTIVIAAVGYVAPWKQLTHEKFMTAVAFERAVGSRWIVSVILTAAILSLFKVFNGNFVAASRLLFALGRRGMVDSRVGTVHASYQTPSAAVLCIGMATAACHEALHDQAVVDVSLGDHQGVGVEPVVVFGVGDGALERLAHRHGDAVPGADAFKQGRPRTGITKERVACCRHRAAFDER